MNIMTVQGVQKYYGSTYVLKGIDLAVKKGEIVAIIGPSGSGKTTLLRCMNGLEDYQEGTIFLGDMLVTHARNQAQEISRDVGMIFQQFHLFPHLTALENVMLAPRIVYGKSKAESRSMAEEMLFKVGMQEMMSLFPSNLSGGQQQRVAIARALAMKPKMLLCDEITSALDPSLVGEVLHVVRNLADEGMTLVLVTHEMAFAREVAHRVVFMYQGRILEQGSAETFFENPKTPELAQFISRIRLTL
ncbi:MAG: amino acid ABC transporter ATP-binding protein [Desulfovibrionaceae bacterium]|nr:amino acid ABC transporter ATP-binding protein [Desulfovibrionaceae bacterium]